MSFDQAEKLALEFAEQNGILNPVTIERLAGVFHGLAAGHTLLQEEAAEL